MRNQPPGATAPTRSSGGRKSLDSLALAFLVACGTACGGAARDLDPGAGPGPDPGPDPGPAACLTSTDCADDNACTAETCATGVCGGTYLGQTAAVLLGAGLDGTGTASFTLATTSGSVIPRTTHTFCPDGADPLAVPPTCVTELDLPSATGATFTPAPGGDGGTLVAALPVRLANLATLVTQTAGTIGSGSLAIAGNGACTGGTQTFASVPVQVEVSIDAGGALDAVATADAVALAGATVTCLSGSVAAQVRALIEEAGRALVRARLQAALEAAVERQLCAGPPCPSGFAEVDGLCRAGGAASAACLARPRDPRTLLLEPAACVP
jgi:hypothetical protein